MIGTLDAPPDRAIGTYPVVVAQAAIKLRVIRQGPRTDELLRHLARALNRDDVEADDSGLIVVHFDGRGPKAWETVRDALDAASPQWREWLYLAPRPRP